MLDEQDMYYVNFNTLSNYTFIFSTHENNHTEAVKDGHLLMNIERLNGYIIVSSTLILATAKCGCNAMIHDNVQVLIAAGISKERMDTCAYAPYCHQFDRVIN
ncbi:MAG: hypothetical protein GFH27_549301n211 [Chloroflexi bacterium AL-W]|nr:hypothetical protein [Chloroflexi bacterium AL-N1]NOK68404.1 hypothetical protein [Chloroflexi bacterium AL-N10]NOK74050.1 hypothetical protein [Chloroflexi bacterium AL-N5]NOK83018.1 hypothetical protein [Chloroflexi bacterium AL-W]NOK90540.1 hypothetical protein [Chloroflexi bacterium AL-N15]